MNHIASLVLTDISIVLVFLALLILILVHEKEARRKKCMMNHPAGSLARTEPSLSGQTKTTSHSSVNSDGIVMHWSTFDPPIEFSPKLHSSEESSSQPHRLEGD